MVGDKRDFGPASAPQRPRLTEKGDPVADEAALRQAIAEGRIAGKGLHKLLSKDGGNVVEDTGVSTAQPPRRPRLKFDDRA
ncbi:hypothetical protein K2P56_04670 [Patescibacteria group bacterium]|nr:hypothetical protein [Patescibacteria group bacterium]